jgi:hypothetical protein
MIVETPQVLKSSEIQRVGGMSGRSASIVRLRAVLDTLDESKRGHLPILEVADEPSPPVLGGRWVGMKGVDPEHAVQASARE